ncbi:MAG: putative toxin-antitoxin system toxin component, PIN family [Candidatus Coatesbacteria bacterium]
MKRAVLDTNVWVSGIVYPGAVRPIVTAARDKRFRPLISSPLLDELASVLMRPRFGYSARAVADFIQTVSATSEAIRPTAEYQVITKDPSDNRVLECATAGDADVIVSGDRHLLQLCSFKGIPIVTPAAFLDTLEIDAT